MRQYEVIYIMDPSLEEDQLTGMVERFQTLVEAQGGSVQHLERWERRRLAYEVKGRREGFYVVMNFRGDSAAEAELARVMGLTDGVLRHMIVRMDERLAGKAIAEAKAAAEAKAKAEAEQQAAEAKAAEAAAAAAAEAAANAPAPAVPAVEPEAEAAPAAEPVVEETQADTGNTDTVTEDTGTEA